MPSLPASQPADDGEADGTPVPPAVDPSSEEPPVTYGGVRKSVGSPLTGAQPNGVHEIAGRRDAITREHAVKQRAPVSSVASVGVLIIWPSVSPERYFLLTLVFHLPGTKGAG